MSAGIQADPDTVSVPWNSSALYVILASSLIGVMGVSLISPIFPELRSVFAVSDARIGLILTVYTLPGIFPIITLVSDRLRAGIMGMRTSMLRLGQTLGPVSFTYLAETAFRSPVNGYRHLIIIFGVVILAAGLVVYPLLRR